MSTQCMPATLAGCYVVSLRPVGEHAALRRAAGAHGARVIALSPWKIVRREDAETRRALGEAMRARHVVATSPAAARAAHALHRLRVRNGQCWYATGTGTASALHLAGIADVAVPARMDSEGLLALPALQDVRGQHVALLTAPGGRDRLAPALQRRGARIQRVDVYDRVPVPPTARGIAALRAIDASSWLVLSSGEALQRVLASLPTDMQAALRTARVSAASARLAQAARDAGFDDVVVACDARPASLLAAAARATQAPDARRT